MQMTDKDWLERVTIAYRAYPYPNKDIEKFVKWMYEQYGIVAPKEKDEQKNVRYITAWIRNN